MIIITYVHKKISPIWLAKKIQLSVCNTKQKIGTVIQCKKWKQGC